MQRRASQRTARAEGRRGSDDGRRLGRFGALALLRLLVLLALVPPVIVDDSRRHRATRSASATAEVRSRARTSSRSCSPAHGLFFNGLFDSLYLYPADQQNYIISERTNVGARRGPGLDRGADVGSRAGRGTR